MSHSKRKTAHKIFLQAIWPWIVVLFGSYNNIAWKNCIKRYLNLWRNGQVPLYNLLTITGKKSLFEVWNLRFEKDLCKISYLNTICEAGDVLHGFPLLSPDPLYSFFLLGSGNHSQLHFHTAQSVQTPDFCLHLSLIKTASLWHSC